ncbi:hypothetical protein [Microbulbifer yueqingensis]|uniref:Uncharacterized protein n=1 Tax=Microbulbifer yueqingensis TaxID=658219 RepID=A0A1G9D2Y1_9GAMM|nr:hypothetical protein [Microbulbifer yueqingensis]SDK58173.1 hypothetical protein SAMN05216212_2718 [Microbulbifer yueqingensis]
MNYEDASVLEMLAQVSVTLAGFIGVVLVFLHGGRGSWTQGERNTIFHLLFTSLTALGLSIAPLVIQAAFGERLVWRVCMPMLGLVHIGGALRASVEFLRGVIAMPTAVVLLVAVGSITIIALSLLVTLGYLSHLAFFTYLLGISWPLLVAVCAFVSLLFRGKP